MLHRYHNIDYILQLDVNTGLDLITRAREKDKEERIFQQWVVQLPVMAYSGKHISFADYKDRVTGANIDRRSVAEILKELDEVEVELQKGGAD